jgi:Xaa-Pro aminopeptidase
MFKTTRVLGETARDSHVLCGMKKISSLFLTLTFIGLQAQEAIQIDPVPMFEVAALPDLPEELGASFFAQNRERLRDTLQDSAMVVLFSAPMRYRTNDIEYKYHQDPDFYYFTGITDEHAMLLLFASPMKIGDHWYREILFIEERQPKKEMWTGKMITEDEAKEISGVSAVMKNTAFKTTDLDWSRINRVLSNRHLAIERDDKQHPGDLSSMVAHFWSKAERANVPVLVDEGEDLFAYLRQHKNADELRMI